MSGARLILLAHTIMRQLVQQRCAHAAAVLVHCARLKHSALVLLVTDWCLLLTSCWRVRMGVQPTTAARSRTIHPLSTMARGQEQHTANTAQPTQLSCTRFTVLSRSLVAPSTCSHAVARCFNVRASLTRQSGRVRVTSSAMLWGGLLLKSMGAGFLFCCYFAMVLLALSSSNEHRATTTPLTLPASMAADSPAHTAATRLTHAYLTTMTNASSLPALITLSRSLLTVQSPYRLVVLLPSSFARQPQSVKQILAALPNVKVEYVKPVSLPRSLSVDAAHSSSFLLLSAFALTQYRRLLFLPLHSWLTRNMDSVLLTPMPLAFSIGVAASYTPLMCASAGSIDELNRLESTNRLEAVPRHYLHPPGSLPFTSAPLLLAPSKAATQQMYSVLEQRDGSYHGVKCRCDDVTDVLADMFHHSCTKQEVERQRQADELNSAVRSTRGGLDHLTHATFYPHDHCTQRLSLNLSLSVHTHHCLPLSAFKQATPLLSLQQCQQQYRLLSAVLPASAATDLAHVQQLSLAHSSFTTPQPATSSDGLFELSRYNPKAEAEREASEMHERKYGQQLLQEQRAIALQRLQRVVDDKVKVHGGGRQNKEAEHLTQCEAVYEAWLQQYFDALSHLRPTSLSAKG